MSTTVTYKGSTLTTATNQTRVLETAGKYMEDDVTIVDVTSGGGSTLITKSISANGTYNATDDSADGYSSVTVSVPTGIDGNNLEYGITDGTIPRVGIAKVESANVWGDNLQMMVFGTGTIGTGRVV